MNIRTVAHHFSPHRHHSTHQHTHPINQPPQSINSNKQDPKAWLKEGLQLRRQPDKAGRRVRNLVQSAMRAGN